MAFTNGSLFGIFDGQATGDVTNTAFNACNLNNPNASPKTDLFLILSLGEGCLLQVTSAGVVNTNVAAGSFSDGAQIAVVQLTAGQMLGLPANPTASQICQAAFPLNFGNQQLDIFQIGTFSPTINVPGGGGVIYRLTYNGVALTT
ncbi:MAG: hypothetical protein OK457_00725 [Thaumarchaeota archaeon]|nr:hypothetical protein [Nitrososphaerota archaeon]